MNGKMVEEKNDITQLTCEKMMVERWNLGLEDYFERAL